ncbi:MAG TPA: DUF2628 domain-containing protein [bacterium]
MRRLWQAIVNGIGKVLNFPIGLERREGPIPPLYHRAMPRRLSWNWPAFIFGPFWYVARGLWVHATIMFGLILLSGGLLVPFVWLYCALKANEDGLEFQIQERSFY